MIKGLKKDDGDYEDEILKRRLTDSEEFENSVITKKAKPRKLIKANFQKTSKLKQKKTKEMPTIIQVESEDDLFTSSIKDINKKHNINLNKQSNKNLKKQKKNTNFLFKRNQSSSIGGLDNKRKSNSLIKLKNKNVYAGIKKINEEKIQKKPRMKRSSTIENKSDHEMVKKVGKDARV